MTILILSCSTGEGHNSAAKAIKEYFDDHGEDCRIVDALALQSRTVNSIVCHGHRFVYRKLPKLFGAGYRFEERHEPKNAAKLFLKGSRNLAEILRRTNYDAVICVHAFAGLMMKDVRIKHNICVPTFFVATDYTCSPTFPTSDCDYYFIPHAKNKEEFIGCGIDQKKLLVTGIPVSQSFYQKQEKTVARKKLCLPENGKVVILACGSMGCGPIPKMVRMITANTPPDTTLVAICGNNRKLYLRLKKENNSSKAVIVGYTHHMNDYMDAADLYLTKAGGLSTTESIAKRLPLIYLDAVPGCEERNYDFMLENGFVQSAKGCSAMTNLVCRCLKDPVITKAMIQKYDEEFNFNAAEKIYGYISELCHKADFTNSQTITGKEKAQ